jgi:hypothetical protein
MSTPSSPDDAPLDELRALRARAYGPDADIHDDPAALARLQQLETQAREAEGPGAPESDASTPAASAEEMDAGGPAAPQTAPHPLDVFLADTAPPVRQDASPAPTPEAGIPSTGDPSTGDPSTGDPSTGDPADPPAPIRRPWYRRTRVLWALSLVAAVLVGVGLTLSVQSLTSGKVAALAVDDGGTWPATFGERPPGGVLFDEFHGLSVVTFPQGFGLDPTELCLYIVAGAGETSTMGSVSCGSGPFPATASLTVTADSPKKLREAFEVGTALKFVHEGDQVQVYAKAPGIVVPSRTPQPSGAGG